MRRVRRRGGRRRRLRLSVSTRAGGRPERPRVLLIAPHNSYRIPAYCRAAARLEADIAVAAGGGAHALLPQGVDGLRVDLTEPASALDRLTAAGRARPFAGVVATDDATVELASRVARELSLPHNPPQAARVARRKDLARAALAAAGAPVPGFVRLDLAGDLRAQAQAVSYPCVVKPLALAGSRGVIRADGADELVAACRRVGAILAGVHDADERRYVLAEDFMPGMEVALEGMLSAGRLEVVALFDKPDPLDGPCFEETYYVTPSRLGAPVQAQVEQRVQEACAAYGLCEGPVHAELRVRGGDARILEVAARTIGGDCARLLEFGAGQSLEELVLAHALGRPLRLQPGAGAAGVLMLPTPKRGTLRRVEGVMRASRVRYVDDVVIAIREGYELVPLPEGSSYLGFIFAHGPTPEAVEAALRAAHACLNVVVAPVWKLEPA